MTNPISARLQDGEARFLKWAYKEHFDGPPVISIPRHPGNIDALLAEAADHIDAQDARIKAQDAKMAALVYAIERCPPYRPQMSDAEFRDAVKKWWRIWARDALAAAKEPT